MTLNDMLKCFETIENAIEEQTELPDVDDLRKDADALECLANLIEKDAFSQQISLDKKTPLQ